MPGGGLTSDDRWRACRLGFFLSVRVLSRLYRRLFLERLQAACDSGALRFFGDLADLAQPTAFTAHLRPLRRLEWVVDAKRPFGGPQQVLDYLGRYTHRVAIANSRLLDLADGQVRFRWKDYRQPERPKVMTLSAGEFIRRFLLHVVPDRFRRIRHFGFLANTDRRAKLAAIRRFDVAAPAVAPDVTGYREHYALLTGRLLDICPSCGGRSHHRSRSQNEQSGAAAPITGVVRVDHDRADPRYRSPDRAQLRTTTSPQATRHASFARAARCMCRQPIRARVTATPVQNSIPIGQR